jgi:hypothetical protein
VAGLSPASSAEAFARMIAVNKSVAGIRTFFMIYEIFRIFSWAAAWIFCGPFPVVSATPSVG